MESVVIMLLTVAMICLVVLTVFSIISLNKINVFIDELKKALEKWEQEES